MHYCIIETCQNHFAVCLPPLPGTSFPAYFLCNRNAINLWDLLPFLEDKCQLSMLRRCHCYPRFPSVPGGGHHWGNSIVSCDTHISTEKLIQLAFFPMKKFPSKIFLEKFHTKSQFYHGFHPPWEVFLTILSPLGIHKVDKSMHHQFKKN